jgi:hypothetical protein
MFCNSVFTMWLNCMLTCLLCYNCCWVANNNPLLLVCPPVSIMLDTYCEITIIEPLQLYTINIVVALHKTIFDKFHKSIIGYYSGFHSSCQNRQIHKHISMTHFFVTHTHTHMLFLQNRLKCCMSN